MMTDFLQLLKTDISKECRGFPFTAMLSGTAFRVFKFQDIELAVTCASIEYASLAPTGTATDNESDVHAQKAMLRHAPSGSPGLPLHKEPPCLVLYASLLLSTYPSSLEPFLIIWYVSLV